MSNCSEHKKDLFGQTDMKLVAEAIVNLHYESHAELYGHLETEYLRASEKDYKEGNSKLGIFLSLISYNYHMMLPYADQLWIISKPFMESNKTIKT